MIDKDDLKGKYITYILKTRYDTYGTFRTHKVIKINGLTLTVKDALGTRHRVHPKKTKIFGRQKKTGIEEIKWN